MTNKDKILFFQKNFGINANDFSDINIAKLSNDQLLQIIRHYPNDRKRIIAGRIILDRALMNNDNENIVCFYARVVMANAPDLEGKCIKILLNSNYSADDDLEYIIRNFLKYRAKASQILLERQNVSKKALHCIIKHVSIHRETATKRIIEKGNLSEREKKMIFRYYPTAQQVFQYQEAI